MSRSPFRYIRFCKVKLLPQGRKQEWAQLKGKDQVGSSRRAATKRPFKEADGEPAQ